MKNILFSLFIFTLHLHVLSQDGVAYYTDNNNNFVVFEKGQKYILEERGGVNNIKAGIDFVAYTDIMDNLKVFYNGETRRIETFIPSEMSNNMHALLYKTRNKLISYEKGIKKVLSERVGLVEIGESIVVWQDEPSFNLMASINGEIYTIENRIEFRQNNVYKIGKNLFAYNDPNNFFKIFYNGQIYDSKSSNVSDFKCGRNTVAFYDNFNNVFKVFQNGVFTTIGYNKPNEYYALDDVVSFTDINGDWNAVKNAKVVLLSNNKSDVFVINQDFIFYYTIGNTNNAGSRYEAYVYYKGEKTKLDNFNSKTQPLVSYHSIVYFDSQGRAYYYYNGKLYQYFVPEKNAIANLNFDLPSFRFGLNSIAFFYDGRLIEYPDLKTEIKK